MGKPIPEGMDIERFNKHYERAKYQNELEGLMMTEEDRENVLKVVTGQMTMDELIEQLKK